MCWENVGVIKAVKICNQNRTPEPSSLVPCLDAHSFLSSSNILVGLFALSWGLWPYKHSGRPALAS